MLIVGALLALLSGACIASSMVLQRYALTYPDYQVPLGCCKLRRPLVWMVGFVAYQAANGLFAAAALFGPLSLLATAPEVNKMRRAGCLIVKSRSLWWSGEVA